ncbi:hypothetical protein [Achromobacter piechaudii]|uniref:Uncharacterized protein n=1 Tax=Achromobacter piechaudii TaxID=72556 RepID=A0A6S7EKG3_9BURK|nr:hypothetical protein [Achromobacter piechaudii]CAB3916075.1 hypothetical protein LMG1861_05089 [Achromobacter piechaudii]
MKLNRNAQRKLLEALATRYPNWTGISAALSHLDYNLDEPTKVGTAHYLADHGLIEFFESAVSPADQQLRITAKGLDFLQDDGGLSAILGIVTIKLHDDTIKQLIEAKILASDLPPQEKKRWTDQLRSLPAETTKHLVMKLVDKGLESGPSALAAIGTILGSAV